MVIKWFKRLISDMKTDVQRTSNVWFVIIIACFMAYPIIELSRVIICTTWLDYHFTVYSIHSVYSCELIGMWSSWIAGLFFIYLRVSGKKGGKKDE